MPTATHHSQKPDAGRAEKQESLNADSKNEKIIPGALEGSPAKTGQKRGENNGEGPVLDEISWDSGESNGALALSAIMGGTNSGTNFLCIASAQAALFTG
jgi:hypothetical protein